MTAQPAPVLSAETVAYLRQWFGTPRREQMGATIEALADSHEALREERDQAQAERDAAWRACDQAQADTMRLRAAKGAYRQSLIDMTEILARVRLALQEYGAHKDWCGVGVTNGCNCGLDAIIKEGADSERVGNLEGE